MTRRLTIGLLWHSTNSANLGVGALTLGNIALIRRAAGQAGIEPYFVILGFVDKGRDAYVGGDDVEIVPLDSKAMIPFGRYHRALRRCDCIVDIGGGDSFTDIYGPKRFAFLWWSKALAIALGKPLILAPQTIGPFTRPIETRLATSVLNKATAVFCRDPASYAAAADMAPGARLRQSVDVAFALPFERPPSSGVKPRIGVNVSGLLYNRGYDRKSSFGMELDYPSFIEALLDALAQREDLMVELVPHVLSDVVPVDDDRAVIAQIASRRPWLRRAPDFVDPIEAKSYISGFDFLTAGRMHACIAAYSSGVAVLPVAYSRKFSGLFEGVLGYPHLVPVTGVSQQAAIDMTLDSIARRNELAILTHDGQAKAKALLDDYVSALAEIMDALAHGRPKRVRSSG